MQPLHDHDPVTGGEIIQASRHGTVPPFDRRAALDIRFCLIHRMRVIHDHIIAALAGSRRHRHHHAVTRSGVFEPTLLVLVVAELVSVTPALLIPGGFDQAPAFDAIPRGQGLPIAAEQPAGLGMINPSPGHPKDCSQQRLGVSRWDVHDQVTDAALRDSLEVVADGAHVHALDEGRFRFEHRPSLPHEFMQASSRFLRTQGKAAEHRPPQGWRQVAGVVRR